MKAKNMIYRVQLGSLLKPIIWTIKDNTNAHRSILIFICT